MPSQVDPAVLAELPADIRAKLAPQKRSIFDNVKRSGSPSAENRSRSASPQVSDAEFVLPSHSQLDPAILAELPEDVRQEVLQQYKQPATRGLPMSPKKPTISGPRKLTTPTKKQKFLAATKKGRSKNSSSSTLTQANFVAARQTSSNGNGSADTEEISESFLAELPADIRQEILDEQRRKRMQAKGGLNLGTIRRRVKPPAPDTTKRGQQTIPLPRQPPRPTFTSRKLSTTKELQDAMVAWVTAFSDEGEVGPYEDDVTALGLYLSRVVTGERDMEKTATVLRWLHQVIDMQEFEKGSPLEVAWEAATKKLESAVQDAVASRGLAPLNLDSG
ncbi:uncharacterized protein AB675_5272 [Cyphellophora attinorum]|uniref:DNA repair protein Rev1 C-terminal domain-containing protein n=1 Tax=Cyphellophora attinorum TaxID=1664694 RepID=A0A0N0NLM7_9EURO|nr:uncharacterized protein AB675_5272 [Phialophora attinorum]KPI39358.1 hypothetical protein AB675_5272 [Phialophora attinorum]